MMLGLCDASEILKDRVEFWNDVYGSPSLYGRRSSLANGKPGFDLSVMTKDLYAEAITDIAGPETMLSEPCVVKVGLYILSLGAMCHTIFAGPLPTAGHATPARFYLPVFSGIDNGTSSEGLGVCGLFRHILQRDRGPHTTGDNGQRYQAERTDVSGGLARGWKTASTTTKEQHLPRNREGHQL
jgi:hypothetical protein